MEVGVWGCKWFKALLEPPVVDARGRGFCAVEAWVFRIRVLTTPVIVTLRGLALGVIYGFKGVLQGFIGFYRVLQGFYRVL